MRMTLITLLAILPLMGAAESWVCTEPFTETQLQVTGSRSLNKGMITFAGKPETTHFWVQGLNRTWEFDDGHLFVIKPDSRGLYGMPGKRPESMYECKTLKPWERKDLVVGE